ncbi:hypothetical protein Cob_v006073 [Colletotrichum orbiculare MAFF 240422]|uniref:Uncharacterized protein n=1 Tax=Colletotrichum orbiculare (strain 104-T / ATCC 96160 / CBS 514.97 / LARS 414 / MAFF 240422) TaxID=1213857 RepID=A0A484FTX3_COLOR|nr:hypothetical protein Cob_v006073 [Colletotrichum orbiculare MAFF 240422]
MPAAVSFASAYAPKDFRLHLYGLCRTGHLEMPSSGAVADGLAKKRRRLSLERAYASGTWGYFLGPVKFMGLRLNGTILFEVMVFPSSWRRIMDHDQEIFWVRYNDQLLLLCA